MTTARQGWEACLTELSKVNAPSILLSDFNYFYNKAINLVINKWYNTYDVNQQSADNLRVLKATTILKPSKVSLPDSVVKGLSDFGAGLSKLFGATYEVYLPLDYLHMLNCICIYKVKERYKCYDAENHVLFAATRLTADAWSTIMNDYYNRPLPERPYYYIHNVNTLVDLPTNPIQDGSELTREFRGTDTKSDYTYTVEKNDEDKVVETGVSNLPRTISLTDITNKSVVEKEAGVRYGNPTSVRCEIRYGLDDSVFELVGVMIDYLKTPLTIRLTQELVNLTRDTSQILEFPDYVCLEIINELVMLVMENTADPRLLTNLSVTQSIANPAQQLAPQPTTRRRRKSDDE